MRNAAGWLVAALLLAASTGARASNEPVQPSYDALIAMSAAERQAALRAMDEPARLAMFQTHVDRWLAQHRARLSQAQIALVTDVRDTLTPERRDPARQRALEQRMVCELWRSDVIALSLPLRDQMSSSRLNDVGQWLSDCVIAPALDAIF
jgi:hypothetical protein